jgi:hypothetical protein
MVMQLMILARCRAHLGLQVDPWLHELNDGFPLLYVRSHAARLPGDLVGACAAAACGCCRCW